MEEVFKSIGKNAEAEKWDAVEGLLEQGDGIIEQTEEGMVRDAGIISAAQKVEYYEVATCGKLASFTTVLKHKDALKLLLKTLEEEKACDEKLTSIADTNLNSKAK